MAAKKSTARRAVKKAGKVRSGKAATKAELKRLLGTIGRGADAASKRLKTKKSKGGKKKK